MIPAPTATPLVQASVGLITAALAAVLGAQLDNDAGGSLARLMAGVLFVLSPLFAVVGTHMAIRGIAAWLRGDDLESARPPGVPW